MSSYQSMSHLLRAGRWFDYDCAIVGTKRRVGADLRSHLGTRLRRRFSSHATRSNCCTKNCYTTTIGRGKVGKCPRVRRRRPCALIRLRREQPPALLRTDTRKMLSSTASLALWLCGYLTRCLTVQQSEAAALRRKRVRYIVDAWQALARSRCM